MTWKPGYFLPLAVFAVVAIALGVGLSLKPREIPSALIDKPVPDFALGPVKGRKDGLAAADFRQGEVAILNVFASWCGPCRVEHPVLVDLAKQTSVPLHGLNYKDKPDAAREFLATLGDPYRKTGADLDGRVGIDWGVYGVPETFIVDKSGRIRMKHIGPLTPADVQKKVLPLIAELSK
ncbi:MAG: DsbE family thiol:disulfide interchange protein [Alphaproteobacteria bacterium]|nr:DsbE family thiol:disulfide interchange protein [Alphaproteobacteria bacterium]